MEDKTIYTRLLPVLERMRAIREQKNDTCVMLIDGRCASGKSTIASMLAGITGAGVVHMDDFYLPMELRSKERLEEPGGNVHYERFIKEILPRLRDSTEFTYRRFDCSRMSLGEERVVAASAWRIVEGAYSAHPVFGDYADLCVFADVEPKEQLRRIAGRNGEEALDAFRQKWLPMEEKYFAAHHIKEKAQICLLNSDYG